MDTFWNRLGNMMREYFAPTPEPEEIIANQNQNTMEENITSYTQEQVDAMLADQRTEIENTFSSQLESLQAAINRLEQQLDTTPAADHSAGTTADPLPAMELSYMDLDIHARVNEMRGGK
jgi:hypothetical protein